MTTTSAQSSVSSGQQPTLPTAVPQAEGDRLAPGFASQLNLLVNLLLVTAPSDG